MGQFGPGMLDSKEFIRHGMFLAYKMDLFEVNFIQVYIVNLFTDIYYSHINYFQIEENKNNNNCSLAYGTTSETVPRIVLGYFGVCNEKFPSGKLWSPF